MKYRSTFDFSTPYQDGPYYVKEHKDLTEVDEVIRVLQDQGANIDYLGEFPPFIHLWQILLEDGGGLLGVVEQE